MGPSPFPELQPGPGRGQGNARTLPQAPLHCLCLCGRAEELTEGRRHQQTGKVSPLLSPILAPIATSAQGAAPWVFSGEGSSARGVHEQLCVPALLPHPKTPLQALGFAPLPTAGFKTNRSSGLFLNQKCARFPLEGKKKKRKHLSATAHRKPSSCPEISERSSVPLPAALASSRTHFPLFILKIFLR